MALPEWRSQWGHMIIWPHETLFESAVVGELESTYLKMANLLLAHGNLMIVCRNVNHEKAIREKLRGVANERQFYQRFSYNTLWIRDFGPFAMPNFLVTFTFNAWGGLYECRLDKALTRRIRWKWGLSRERMAIERSSLLTNGTGAGILSAGHRLNPVLNPNLNVQHIEHILSRSLDIEECVWLRHGIVSADRTGSHIGLLLHFLSERQLVVSYDDSTEKPQIEDYVLFEAEITELATKHGWELLFVPLQTLSGAAEQCHPASYCDFLLTGNSLILPTYGVASDESVLERIQQATSRQVTPFNAAALVTAGGSLHRAVLELPQGCFDGLPQSIT